MNLEEKVAELKKRNRLAEAGGGEKRRERQHKEGKMSARERRSPARPQVLAANVDKVFIVCSLEGRFRARRLERLLVLAWQNGTAPVAALTKNRFPPRTQTVRSPPPKA